MNTDDPNRFHFRVNEPAGPMKLAEWIAWRESEDRRLEAERAAFYERRAEAMAAQFERDVNDLTQH